MMTKYYRVRSQEQWDWLANKLNIYCVKSMGCPVIIEHEQGRKSYNVFKYYGGFEPVIEVSQLMEDEKMENEDYVTIKGEDLEKVHWETNYGHTSFINHDENGEKYAHEQYLPANLIISKSLLYPKVPMTEAEKKEFDELKKEVDHASEALSTVRITDFGESNLARKIYRKHELSELDFARAWADPSLIEVTPEKKWNVKVPISHERDYYYKDAAVGGGKTVITNRVGNGSELWTDYDFQFTAGELKHYGLDDDMYEKVEVKE